MKLNPYAKAIVGAAVAGLTALGTALADDQVTTSEWVTAAVAALATLGIVYAVPNRPPTVAPPTVAPPTVAPPTVARQFPPTSYTD